MKKCLKSGLTLVASLLIAQFASAFCLVSQWNSYDVTLHCGVIVDPYVNNQMTGNIGMNCHGYAFFTAYGLPVPQPGLGAGTTTDVLNLINSGELVYLGQTFDPNATHVLYYDQAVVNGSFDPIAQYDELVHSAIVSQFDCFPYVEGQFVQGANGMTQGVSLHTLADYDPANTTPVYFRYTPNTGSLIPPDFQPDCPPSILTCTAIVMDPLVCLTDRTATIGVMHSADNPSTHTYQWVNGHTTAIVSGLPAGTYTVTVTEAPSGETCVSTVTVDPATSIISYIGLVPHDGSPCIPTLGGGFSGTGSATVGTVPGGSYTYQWDAGAHNQTTPTATALCGGTYTVTVTDVDAGCTEEVTFFIPGGGGKRLFVAGEESADFKVFPNPSNGTVFVNSGQSGPTPVEVRDLTGRLILSTNLSGANDPLELGTAGPGIYLISVSTANGMIHEKVVIE